MRASILAILASRGRPGKCHEAVKLCQATSSDADIVLSNDHDDPDIDGYKELANQFNIKQVIEHNKGSVSAINSAFNQYPYYDYYCFFGDDHHFRTGGWDKLAIDILNEETDGWGIFYGNDLLQGEKLPTSFIISGKLVRAMGFIGLPELVHLYVDDFIKNIGGELGILRYREDVIIEHMHYTNGKSQVDKHYLRVNSEDRYKRDKKTYQEWIHNHKSALIKNIQLAMSLKGTKGKGQ